MGLDIQILLVWNGIGQLMGQLCDRMLAEVVPIHLDDEHVRLYMQISNSLTEF